MKRIFLASVLNSNLFLNAMHHFNKPLLSTDQLYEVLQLQKEKLQEHADSEAMYNHEVKVCNTATNRNEKLKKLHDQFSKESEKVSEFCQLAFDQKIVAWCDALIPAWCNQQMWCPIPTPAWYDDRQDKQDGLPDLERESVPNSRFWHIFAYLARQNSYQYQAIIEKMLKSGINPTPPKEEFPGQKPDPLFAACRAGAFENVKTLLEYGALANDSKRAYSLMHETEEYVTPIFCVLQEAALTIKEHYSADTKQKERLRYLSATRDDIISLLLFYGANARMPLEYEKHRNNALTYLIKHFEVDFSCLLMIKRLRYTGLNPEKKYLGARSAIDQAKLRDNSELIAALKAPLEPYPSREELKLLFPDWGARGKCLYVTNARNVTNTWQPPLR